MNPETQVPWDDEDYEAEERRLIKLGIIKPEEQEDDDR